MALRMLVKDLLILFQACNEGVINVLGEQIHRHHAPRTEYPGQNTILKCPRWTLAKRSGCTDISASRQNGSSSSWALPKNCKISSMCQFPTSNMSDRLSLREAPT